MPRLATSLRLVFLASIAVSLSGCERGCAVEWLSARKKRIEAVPAPFGRAIDCPDGLARCVGGVVEASRVARIAMPCARTESREGDGCSCPWIAVGDCPRGCAAEGVQVVASTPSAAAARLCAPDPSNPVARPAPAAVAPPQVCDARDGDSYRCTASLVVHCANREDGGTAAHVLAACIRGCAHDGDSVGAEETDAEGATRILCAR